MRAIIHTQEERMLILDRITGHRPELARALLQFSWATGLRTAEMAGLQISDIVLTGNPKLVVRAAISKTGVARELPLTSEAVRAINVLKGNRTTGHMIVGRQDKPYSPHTLSERFRKLYSGTGIQGSAYSGRRGLATKLVESGAPLPVVQRVLGHEHLSSTQAYISVTDTAVHNWLEKVA